MNSDGRLTIASLNESYPPSDSSELRASIRDELERQDIRIAVLDDDPTGIQTVHDCTLYTAWDEPRLEEALQADKRMFYVLTNSRSVGAGRAEEIYREISSRLSAIATRTGTRLIAISRSDSTLRGHFGPETRAMQTALMDSEVSFPLPFVQVMFEAGRYTYMSDHYVDVDGTLVKAEETEFARDKEFGYRSSHVPTYIRDKLGDDDVRVACLCENTLRGTDVDGVADWIQRHIDHDYLCPDALSYIDLETFALALLRTMSRLDLRTIVCRSSSSFPRALSGQEPISLLRGSELRGTGGPGVVFVGSHVQKTTRQLEHLLSRSYTDGIEVSPKEIHDGTFDRRSLLKQIGVSMESGNTPIIYTARDGLFLDDPDENLALSRAVSSELVAIYREVPVRPAFVVSKGGITSHDLLTRGADVTSAEVRGAVLPGVPVLHIGADGDTPFVIFPGNVGADESVTEVVDLLRAT